MAAQQVLHLVIRLAHLHPLLGLGTAGDDAPIVVAEHDDGRAQQIGAEHALAAGVETVAVDQGVNGLWVHFEGLR